VKFTSPKRGRPEGRNKQINPVLPSDAHAAIALLVKRRRFGDKPNEVARYLILRALEVLASEGLLPPGPIDPDQD
jgi:hypothetical protein